MGALLMYRAGGPVRDIPIQSSVNVPAGWGIGTSLTPISPYDPQRPAGAWCTMPPRPSRCWKTRRFLTGIYFREYPLAPELTPKYYVDVVGDSAEVVEIRPSAPAPSLVGDGQVE
jgi:hypothetical protein